MFNKKPTEPQLGEILEVFESAATKLTTFVEAKQAEQEAIQAKLTRVSDDITKGTSVLAKFKNLLS